MMITTTYKCDRCGAESTERATLDLKKVIVGVEETGYSYGTNYVFVNDILNRGKEMCIKCREELGLRQVQKKEGEPEKTYPTLEEMIREVIREIRQAG